MRQGGSITGLIIFLVFLFLIDLYAFQGVRTLTRGMTSLRWKTVIHWGYWIINAGIFAAIIVFALNFSRLAGPSLGFGRIAGLLFIFLIPKLVVLIFLMGEDIYRVLRMAFAGVFNMFNSGPADKMTYSVERRKFISQVGLIAAAIPFAGILHGLTFGKFKYTVRRETLHFPDLPDAFDGFTITQVSDIHVGSFDPATDRAEIEHAISMINEQKSDLLLFTGDLVNNRAEEMKPWMDVFSKMHAPYGKYSVFGNHDYGDYVSWDEDPKQDVIKKAANLERLKLVHKELGFRLMLNENTTIEKNGQKLWLLGVENWGTGGFVKHGDLDRALAQVPLDGFKILMSHDPSHWDTVVRHKFEHIHLTLSGHTHGAQFGVEIPGIKWSPIKYRYPYWAGLYKEGKRYIYVNRGFGFLALPARVGIWPEITVLTLKKGTA